MVQGSTQSVTEMITRVIFLPQKVVALKELYLSIRIRYLCYAHRLKE